MCVSPRRGSSQHSDCEESGSIQSCSCATSGGTAIPGVSFGNNLQCDATSSLSNLPSETQATVMGFVDSMQKIAYYNPTDHYPSSVDDDDSTQGIVIASVAPRSVRFSTLTIREYQRCLGDNVPSSGAPVTIVWDHDSEAVYSVQDYEDAVEETRRAKSELKIPGLLRAEILQGLGYSRREVQEASKQSAIARNKRRRTNRMMARNPCYAFFRPIKKAGAKVVASIIGRRCP